MKERDMNAELQREVTKSIKMRDPMRRAYYEEAISTSLIAVTSYEKFVGSWAGQQWLKARR